MGNAVRHGRRKNEYVYRVFVNAACIAHNHLFNHGAFKPFQLLFGHEPEPPEGEPIDTERAAEQRGLRQKLNTESLDRRT